jgi:hypothetical protein
MAWVNVRIIVDTLRCGFLPDVPERIDWSAGECKGEESGDASCDTKTHDDVNGEYCFLYGEKIRRYCVRIETLINVNPKQYPKILK